MSQWNVGDDDKKDYDSDVGVFFCFYQSLNLIHFGHIPHGSDRVWGGGPTM
jgi:hypothetical protein